MKTDAQPPAWEVKATISPNDHSDFAPDLSRDRGFGWSIAVSGDTLIAGSWDKSTGYWDEDTNTFVYDDPHPGSARVFVRTSSDSNTDWEQQGDPLIVDDGESGVYYGYRVAVDGDTALISATHQVSGIARLFVFERSNAVWQQSKMLHVREDYYDDGNILRVALEGNTGEYLCAKLFFFQIFVNSDACPYSYALAILGQPGNETRTSGGTYNPQNNYGYGQVFIYTRSSNGDWSDQPQVLVASDRSEGDYFGDDVAISGDRILVGASEKGIYALNDDDTCCNYTDYMSPQRGKAYIFINIGGTWVQDGPPLYPDDDATDPRFHFGAYVSLDGDTALVGHDAETTSYVYWDYDIQQYTSQANLIVYGFSLTSGGTWEQLIKLTPSAITDYDWDMPNTFGKGVKLKGNRALINGGYRGAILFENWNFIKTEGAFLASGVKSEYGRIGWLDLGQDAIFVGVRDYDFDDIGRVNVVDSFSVLPVSFLIR